MNAIEIQHGEGTTSPTARIVIDGVDFVECVREFEAPFSDNPRPETVGRYQGIPLWMCVPPMEWLLGKPLGRPWYLDGRTLLLSARSPIRDTAEGPVWNPAWKHGNLYGQIEVTGEVVRWRDFKKTGSHLDYQGFGPFEFQRRAYEHSLTLRPTDPFPECAISYDSVFTRGGKNIGDEDFAFTRCPECRVICLLEYEVDTIFFNSNDLSQRVPAYEAPFNCPMCSKEWTGGPWIGTQQDERYLVSWADILESDWKWAVRQDLLDRVNL